MKQVNMTMQYTTEWKALTPCSEHALSRLQDATKRNSVTVASHRAHRTVTAAAVHIIDSVDRYSRLSIRAVSAYSEERSLCEGHGDMHRDTVVLSCVQGDERLSNVSIRALVTAAATAAMKIMMIIINEKKLNSLKRCVRTTVITSQN